jgi:nucleotide-binding universal stress UspA family protein
MKLERILVPTDFSETAERALQQAVLLARSRGIQILVLHNLPPLLPDPTPVGAIGFSGWMEMGPLLDNYTQQAMESDLDTTAAILRKARSWDADLIAIGTHGRSGLEKLTMGSVATKVLHRSESKLLLLRSESELFDPGRKQGPILVPIDFSEHSQRALAFARLLSSEHGAPLHLLHMVELVRTPLKPAGLSSQLEETPGLREKYMEALSDMLGGTKGDVTVADGSPAGGILWWREKLAAGLVVMGSRGHTGLARLLVGSVAENVVRFCEVPVVVVK